MKATNRMNDAMRRIRKAAHEVQEASGQGNDSVNVVGRSNVVVSGTTGGEGSVHSASAHQTTHIRQANGQNVEERDTISSHENI